MTAGAREHEVEALLAGQIALAPLHGGEAALAADRDRLAGHARRTEAPQEHVETDAVAADDDQVGGRGSRSAEGDDIDGLALVELLDARGHDEVAVRLAPRGHRARPLADRICDE